VSTTKTRQRRRVVIVDESALAKRIGQRIRAARLQRGLSQRELAGERFTGQYVSSLERGAVKPSMAALNYLAERLHTSARELLDPPEEPWSRVEADVLLASGDVQSAADRYRDLIQRAPSPSSRAEALLGLAESLCRLNSGADAISPASEAAELFKRLGRERDGAWATYWLASAQYQTDNLSEARSLLDGLLHRVRTGLQIELGFNVRLLTSLASVEGWAGDHQAALSYLEEGRELVDGLDPRLQASYFFSLARSYKQSGDLEAAVRAGIKSLTLYEGMGATFEVSVLYNHLALTHLKLGNTERASQFVAIAAEGAHSLHDQRAEAWVTETRAEIALAREQYEEALRFSQRVLDADAQATSPETALSALLTAAKAHRAVGDTAEARERYERAAAAVRAGGGPARRREVLAEFAEFLAESGDGEAALAIYRDALR
jgi:tetratricopeptide (TPR) repeat protein